MLIAACNPMLCPIHGIKGWTIGYDDEGDPYYADWAAGMLTYEDPRVVADPRESKVLGATIGMGSFSKATMVSPFQLRVQ